MKQIITLLILMVQINFLFAQNFEKEKINDKNFTDLKVKVGADFALQLQGLEHTAPTELIDLKKNFNLPTANFHITADLAPGIQLFLNNYMSSRHHNESWVEGGYLVIDKLPFLSDSDKVMRYLTLKAGVMMPDYGDAHYFRSNNGDVFNNPFVGNWIMDAYTNNPGMEVMFRKNGVIAVAGANNGRMNYGEGNSLLKDLVFNWKLGYDKSINDNLRIRASLSGYHVGDGHSGSTLWDGDRAGARYYYVMQSADSDIDNFRSGRWSPGSNQTEMNSYMGNLFVKFSGLEVFGIYETMKGVRNSNNQNFTQSAIQALYRYSDFYVGGRWNRVSNNDGSDVERFNIGGGWYMINYIVIKLDYVNQKYNGIAHGLIDGGKFNGLVLEAAISF